VAGFIPKQRVPGRQAPGKNSFENIRKKFRYL